VERGIALAVSVSQKNHQRGMGIVSLEIRHERRAHRIERSIE
jgi:hypothetical protein